MKRKTGPPCAFFPFYVDDFLSSPIVLQMSPAERGAYVTLLAISWSSDDCKLKNDDNLLAEMSGLGQKWHEKSGALVKRAFVKRGQYLFHSKLKNEWNLMWQKLVKCSNAGRASAKVRNIRALRMKGPTKGPLKGPLNINSRALEPMLQRPFNAPSISAKKSVTTREAKSSKESHATNEKPTHTRAHVTRTRALSSLNSSLNSSLKEGESEGGEPQGLSVLSDGLLEDLEGMRYPLVVDSLLTGGAERDLALIWLQYHKACPRGRSRWPAAKDFILPYLEAGLDISEVREYLREFKGMSDEPIFKALEPLRSRATEKLNGRDDDKRFLNLGEETGERK